MGSPNRYNIQKIDFSKPYQFNGRSTIFVGGSYQSVNIINGPTASFAASGVRVNSDILPSNSGVYVINQP